MTTDNNTTKDQNVPAIRSDSVVAYLSQLSSALTNIATDLNNQIANITATMSNVTNASEKENSNG